MLIRFTDEAGRRALHKKLEVIERQRQTQQQLTNSTDAKDGSIENERRETNKFICEK